MKYFGMILLSGYFLARENELFSKNQQNLKTLLKLWVIYVACAGSALFFGMLPLENARFQPAIILAAALLPAWLFQGRTVCALAGAATAYSVLRFVPNWNQIAILLLIAETSILVIAFFYQGARERMLRLFGPAVSRGSLGALGLLFAIAVLLGIVWQKAIQIV